MPLTLTILGADGSFPAAGGACSGYLLRAETTSVWLDAGTGSYANLKRHIAFEDIDAVILSHEHADHCMDVLNFAVELMVTRRGRKAVPVYAPVGVRKALTPYLHGITEVAFTDISSDTQLQIGDMQFRFSRTDHPVETLAVRADHDDRSFVYSSDTGPGWQASQLGKGVDLVVLEAGSHVAQPHVHMTPEEAGASAKAANAKRLVLTHLRPDHDRAVTAERGAQGFDAPVQLAAEGAVFDV